MVRIKDITDHLDNWAHPSLAESYDNVGLLVGNSDLKVSAVLVSLDCTEAIVEEAHSLGANLIVSHHPLIFKGLKRLTGKSAVERTVMAAISKGIAIYAIHTNLDNVYTGVNRRIAEKLGLQNLQILQPKSDALEKLTFFAPEQEAERVTAAIFSAGGGKIGSYGDCSFRVTGKGTFTPLEGATPHIGEVGKSEEVVESRVELIYPQFRSRQVVNALLNAHPYEEVSFLRSCCAMKTKLLAAECSANLRRLWPLKIF